MSDCRAGASGSFLAGVAVVTAFVAVSGCGQGSGVQWREGALQQRGRGSLVEVEIPNGVDTLFWSAETHLAIDEHGRVAVLGVAAGVEQFLLHVLDTRTRTITSGIRVGSGPGEVSASTTLISGDSGYFVVDYGAGSLLGVDVDVRVRAQTRFPESIGYVLAWNSGAMHVVALTWADSPEAPVITRYRGLERPVPIIRAGDTAVSHPIANWQGRSVTRRIPPYAVGDSLVAIADPLHYTIRYYALDGTLLGTSHRDVPPKRRDGAARAALRESLSHTVREYGAGSRAGASAQARLDSLDRERVPHFAWPGMGFDAAGRLLVIGEFGDSTFVDVFTPPEFLGRFAIDCIRPGRRVAIRGSFLALHCEDPASDTSPFRLRIFRIERSQ